MGYQPKPRHLLLVPPSLPDGVLLPRVITSSNAEDESNDITAQFSTSAKCSPGRASPDHAARSVFNSPMKRIRYARGSTLGDGKTNSDSSSDNDCDKNGIGVDAGDDADYLAVREDEHYDKNYETDNQGDSEDGNESEMDMRSYSKYKGNESDEEHNTMTNLTRTI